MKTGHDIASVTRGHASGCAGALAYYTRSGEPPGTWEGRGTAALGVSGTVAAEVAERLYQEGVGPSGERIIRHAAPKTDEDQAAAEALAIARYQEEHPFASASEINAERTRIRAKSPGISRSYYDLTSSASKSVSVLYASLRAWPRARPVRPVMRSRPRPWTGKRRPSRMPCSTRSAKGLSCSRPWPVTSGPGATPRTPENGGTGKDSSRPRGCTRSAGTEIPSCMSTSRSSTRCNAPTGADDQWRAADGQHFYQLRQLYGVTVDRAFERRLLDMGYAMVERADGNGAEVGGVSQQVMDQFSSRARAST